MSTLITIIVSVLNSKFVTSDDANSSSVCHSKRVYLNLFKVKIKGSSSLSSVQVYLSKIGFVYNEQIVSNFHSFSLNKTIQESQCPINQTWYREINHPAIQSINQDYKIIRNKRLRSNRKSQAKSPSIGYDVKNTPTQRRPIYVTYESQNDSQPINKILIGVLDIGFQMDHPNLINIIDRRLSYDFLHNDRDPSHFKVSPTLHYDPQNWLFITVSHGTMVMGCIASEGRIEFPCNRTFGQHFKLVGIQIMDRYTIASDIAEAKALLYTLDEIPIYSASYGTTENIGFSDIREASKEALAEGINKGRDCKGRIYVYPSGNGDMDNCNMDGYAKSVYTLTIADVNRNQELPSNKERCPCILAAAIVDDRFFTTAIHDSCVNGLEGSSFAVPVAASAIGDMLFVNPDLTKRDIEHIIIQTASPLSNSTSNGAGWKSTKIIEPVTPTAKDTDICLHTYNDRVGFGIIDRTKMVAAAEKWHPVPQQLACEIATHGNQFQIETGCGIHYLEHVEVQIRMCCKSCLATDFGTLHIDIHSAMKTSSAILTESEILKDNTDIQKDRCTDWTFMTMQFWGESPHGNWNVTWTEGPQVHFYITTRTITLYGTDVDPLSKHDGVPYCHEPSSPFEGIGKSEDSFPASVIVFITVLTFTLVLVIFAVGISRVSNIIRKLGSYKQKMQSILKEVRGIT